MYLFRLYDQILGSPLKNWIFGNQTYTYNITLFIMSHDLLTTISSFLSLHVKIIFLPIPSIHLFLISFLNYYPFKYLFQLFFIVFTLINIHTINLVLEILAVISKLLSFKIIKNDTSHLVGSIMLHLTEKIQTFLHNVES